MTTDEIFEVWAPAEARWSPWTKPVLFACMDRAPGMSPLSVVPFDTNWLPMAEEKVALVLDLPGADGVAAGLTLAERGYRPVPLYNAVPGPTSSLATAALPGPIALVDVEPIACALWHGTERLRQLSLVPEAPPVFLLDATRRGEGRFAAPGRFDNRSISFTTDFPSPNFLIAQGVRRAVLVQVAGDQPQPDLAHTLRRWQEGRVGVDLKRLDVAGQPVLLDVRKPSGFGVLWHRTLQLLGLRRHALGGFGGFIPHPSAG